MSLSSSLECTTPQCIFKLPDNTRCVESSRNKTFCKEHGAIVRQSDYHKICNEAIQFDCTNLDLEKITIDNISKLIKEFGKSYELVKKCSQERLNFTHTYVVESERDAGHEFAASYMNKIQFQCYKNLTQLHELNKKLLAAQREKISNMVHELSIAQKEVEVAENTAKKSEILTKEIKQSLRQKQEFKQILDEFSTNLHLAVYRPYFDSLFTSYFDQEVSLYKEKLNTANEDEKIVLDILDDIDKKNEKINDIRIKRFKERDFETIVATYNNERLDIYVQMAKNLPIDILRKLNKKLKSFLQTEQVDDDTSIIFKRDFQSILKMAKHFSFYHPAESLNGGERRPIDEEIHLLIYFIEECLDNLMHTHNIHPNEYLTQIVYLSSIADRSKIQNMFYKDFPKNLKYILSMFEKFNIPPLVQGQVAEKYYNKYNSSFHQKMKKSGHIPPIQSDAKLFKKHIKYLNNLYNQFGLKPLSKK